ncbi:MAG: threonine/serine exporter family protein [Lachnospiraceae bacterium]|nr:threonine/serine exporter family protein [Lachnospiraceae bacterium]
MRQAVVQVVMGMCGAVGFSILFNVRGKKLVAAGLGAALSWSVYLALYHIYNDKIAALLGAALTVAVLAEILARVMKAPVIILLVPMLIPLIPGSDLYYMTTNLVLNNTAESAEYLNLVMREAGVIAFAVILVTCAVQVIMKVYRHFTVKR